MIWPHTIRNRTIKGKKNTKKVVKFERKQHDLCYRNVHVSWEVIFSVRLELLITMNITYGTSVTKKSTNLWNTPSIVYINFRSCQNNDPILCRRGNPRNFEFLRQTNSLGFHSGLESFLVRVWRNDIDGLLVVREARGLAPRRRYRIRITKGWRQGHGTSAGRPPGGRGCR